MNYCIIRNAWGRGGGGAEIQLYFDNQFQMLLANLPHAESEVSGVVVHTFVSSGVSGVCTYISLCSRP